DIEEMLKSYDQDVVAQAMAELGKLPPSHAIEILERLAVEDDPEYRCCALDGMASISRERAEGLALRLLGDPDGAVRGYACDTLGELESPKVVDRSARLLESDPDELVRDRAAYWLGELGDMSALPVLRAAAERDLGTDHEGTPIREHIMRSIKMI